MITTIGEIAEFQKGFAFKSKDYQDAGVRIVRVTNLNRADYTDGNSLFIDKTKALEYEKYNLIEDDVVISTVGSWPTNPASVVGKVAIIPKEISGSLLNQNAVKLRAKIGCIQKYLGYILRDSAFANYIIGTAQGSASQASITLEDIRRYEIELPDIELQKKRVEILETIDDKIKNNIAINRNLLEQANALFTSWFVDFEPFGGKVPEDWIEGSLDDIVEFSNGYAFKSKELLDAPDPEAPCYHVFKQGHINRGGGFNIQGTKSWYPKEKAEKLEKYVLKKGDILMAMTDMKDNVAILGNTAVMEVDDEYIVNQRVGLLRVKGKDGIDYPYVSLLTNSFEFLKDLRSRANSGVQVNLSSNEIKNSSVLIATEKVNKEFDQIVHPLFEIMMKNDIENLRLADLRDTILPKLMSGELDVSDLDF